MSLSLGIPTVSPVVKSSDDNSVHDSTHHAQRHHNNSSRGMRAIDPNNSSRGMRTIDPNSPNDSSCLPPVVYHMSYYAKRASSRFRPYQPGKHVPTALEHRFIMKNILKHNEADISLIDVQQGKEIFKKGIQHMSNATLQSAVIAKRADAESKRLHALATAWDLESTERHAVLLQTIMKDNAERYLDSLAEAAYFESMMAKHSNQQLEDDADFTIAAYTQELTAHSIAEQQLGHLEEISAERDLASEDTDEKIAEAIENRLDGYLDSVVGQGKNMIMVA